MIVVGHITTTHGIKGELKCYTDFSRQDLVFHENQKVYINGKEHRLTSLRTHKNHYLITLDDLLLQGIGLLGLYIFFLLILPVL